MKRDAMRLMFICVALLISTIPVHHDSHIGKPRALTTPFSTGQIILKLKTKVSTPDALLAQILPDHKRIIPLSTTDPTGPFLVSLPTGMSVEQAVNTASGDDKVEYAEPNYTVSTADRLPNDPYFEFMWQLRNNAANELVGKRGADIDAVRAWDISTGSSDVIVAVLDTGVELSHPDLAANAWINPGEVPNNSLDDDHNGYTDDVNGWNFLHDNNRLFEDPAVDYHGTHVAGIIGAVGNNRIGVTGVAWRVKLMALKVLDGHENKGVVSNSLKAIEYVISRKNAGANIRVINASWVHEGKSRAMRDAIEAAGRAGIVFVCAAGNEAKDLDVEPRYPAARSVELDCVISVAATDRFDNLQPYSNYGRKTISVAAPGNGILGLGLGDQYAEHSGTSMATAHVSGIVVLMVAHNPALTVGEIKRRMIATAEPVASLAACCLSVGRANAFNVLTNRIPPAQKLAIGAVQVAGGALIVDGLGFVKGSSVIEVNGDMLSALTYDDSYTRPVGNLTRLTADLGEEKIKQMFPYDAPAQICVYNRRTKERSNIFTFIRRDPKAPQ